MLRFSPSCNIRKTGLVGLLAGNAPNVSHLFFADDSIMFGKASRQECEGLREVIDLYSLGSGQLINFDKSTVCFSPNTATVTRDYFGELLQVREVKDLGTYLGMPSYVGRSKNVVFDNLLDRVWGKLNGWSSKLLSTAGKEVLIKSVAQSIPTYMMTCFKFPRQVTDELNSMISRFWWGKVGGKRGVYWTKWLDLRAKRLWWIGVSGV